MSSNPFARNLENISDPSDWSQTKVPELTDFDSLLRCFICKEFLRAPVITGCNHTFCSQCIRESLLSNNHCPLCDSEQFESNLKRVIQLEEVVRCFSKLRPAILNHLQQPPSRDREGKKRPRPVDAEVIEVSDNELEDAFDNARGSSSGLEDSTTSPTNTPLTSDIPSGDTLSPPLTKKHKTTSPARDAVPTRDQMVGCPICGKMMTAEILQSNHIDSCLSGTTATPSVHQVVSRPKKPVNGISSFFKKKTTQIPSTVAEKKPARDFYFREASKHHSDIKKLPKLDFSSLTTSKLKEKLSTLKLPTNGTRTQLEVRYNHYYVLFNSNLDSNHPVSEKILKQKLNQWELQSSTNNSNSLFGSGVSTRNILDKNFLINEWNICYKEEFSRLTKLARRSLKKAKELLEQDLRKDQEEKIIPEQIIDTEGKTDISTSN